MPPKVKLPAPIDRPLSRAYLREFTGWSTAFPPGVSDSSSLRIMENMMIQRDGSIRIRPGMRFLSYAAPPTDENPTGTAFDRPIVGSHEPFFLNDGSKAYLFACREEDGTVGFRVFANTTEGQLVVGLTDFPARFSVPQGEPFLNFSADTTYVKYLQIDNKVLALSDAGEPMRIFSVGSTKTARRIVSIDRPDWSVEDKLSVMHPNVSWASSTQPLTTRTNLLLNPSFETNTTNWAAHAASTAFIRDQSFNLSGAWSLRLSSKPERTNLIKSPLHNPAITGLTGWAAGDGTLALDVANNAAKLTLDAGAVGAPDYLYSSMFSVTAGKEYDVAFNLSAITNVRRLWVRAKFYNSADVQVGSTITYANETLAVGRKAVGNVKPPTGATQMRVFIYGERKTATGVNSISVKNVVVCAEAEDSAAFSGDSGTNYFWTGEPNNSASVYHPPKDISVKTTVSVTPGTYTGSMQIRGTTTRNTYVTLQSNSAAALLLNDKGPDTPDTAGAWTEVANTTVAPSGTLTMTMIVWVEAVPFGEFHYLDDGQLEKAGAPGTYFDGSTPDSTTVIHAWTGTAHGSTSTERTYAAISVLPTPETKTPDTLIASVAASNKYNFALFYTFSNEIGESAASSVTTVRTQRSWSAWRWELPNSAGEPGGTTTNNPDLCADQLVAYMPSDVFASAIAAGATSWNLYVYSWSDQDPVPVTALRVASQPLNAESTHTDDGVLRVTPSMADAGTEAMIVPTKSTRYNYSAPSCGGQGLVAADRLVIVKDPTAAAVIRWTSNQQGSYTDFTASRGGGFKTLTSGNLFIPACVKLWQNPQSADTLTILCRGVDGYNTGYYMAPAQIASQSEATNIMGFEETTATPGTTSPYACEVFNNALYHPLDDQLMKSTATNYNINHKSQTDNIENMWKQLTRKEWMVSSVHDNRIFYIVNNPQGEPLENGCNGNEIWVFDGGASSDKGGGSWSRWLIQAHSLRKIEQGGMIRMSVVRPAGVFYFDDLYGMDDVVGEDLHIGNQAIPWKMETNTQGANRAHDAYAHLQQCNVVLGNFTGSMCFGVKGWNVHGKPVDVYKHITELEPLEDLQSDLEAFLLVRQDMKEWFFYANSETIDEDPEAAVLPSYGEINLVQYRYSPVSVNVGYEYGSIETFEYGRAERLGALGLPDELTTNGVPRPYVDTRRP